MMALGGLLLARRLRGSLLVALLVSACSVVYAAPDKVTTYQDSKGWKLKVNGKDFYMKGVVWGYTPKNENYTYNLWSKPDHFIKKVLDYDFGLMKKAGVNAVRSFAEIPPKWVTYVYQQHGIMTAINPLMGRYGASIGGTWRANTDYSDPLTRKVLKAEVLKTVQKYKDVPGVLMFALGNESNYGLSWKSFEIENLPEGEKNTKKARYLYSLFDEVIDAGKKIDPNHPFTIVNGDIQYIDIISEYAQDWDLLGVNAYRGVSFTGLWKDVKDKLNLPIAFFEFGSDAFNAREYTEDQAAQAHLLKGQWHEMYQKSYGNGAEGNSIGGFVFEWRDEWWKYKQTERLDKHDRNASWSNGGYAFDYVKGQNNMNEEWFGITRLGNINADGVYTAEPRMAYNVLADIWRVDPYKTPSAGIDTAFSRIDMNQHEVKSEMKLLKNAKRQSDAFRMTGGSVKLDMLGKALGGELDDHGQDGISTDYGLMGSIDFEFQPNRKVKGDFTINFAADASKSSFEHKYGDRVNDEGLTNGGDKIELYDFQVGYIGEGFDLEGFYHVPRYHWGDKGDFFGLLRETTDMEGQDIWNSKAPYGVEFIGKKGLDGLNIVAGPEVYWGANPKAILKYQFGKDKRYTFMHSEDFSKRSGSSTGKEPVGKRSRQTTLQAKFQPTSSVTFQVGGIVSGTTKIGDKYDYLSDGNVVQAEIKAEDTLGLKAHLAFDLVSNVRAYTAFNYAGLVADGGAPIREMETQLPYSSQGNKKEFEIGLKLNKGAYMITPRLLYRENLVDANPLINPVTSGTTLTAGIDPRNTDDDPFAVLGNRAARSAELYLTYDPTPGTYFYDWDNDLREDAKFAFNVGLTATKYTTATDAYLFYYEEGERNAAFGSGLPEEDVWLLKSKLVFNPRPGMKAIAKLEAGKQQSTGESANAIEYYGAEGKLILNDEHIISAAYKKDGWGKYDYERQFNLTYPEQLELSYTKLLNKGLGESKSSKVGVKALYRTLDENSPAEFYDNGKNDDMFEIQTFLEYKF